MADIVERLRFDSARCEMQFSKGVAGNIEEAAAEIQRLRAELFKIQCQQLRVATATDMTRLAMREAAMDTRNEIIKVLAGEQTARLCKTCGVQLSESDTIPCGHQECPMNGN